MVQPGGYKLTDETYAKLLHRLVAAPGAAIPSSAKDDVLQYYSDPEAPIYTKMYPERWARVQADLSILATMPVTDSVSPALVGESGLRH